MIGNLDDKDEALRVWTDLFMDVVSKHTPLKVHRVKNEIQPNWLTTEILDAMKTRDQFKARGNHAKYKEWRNKITSMIKKAKKSYYQSLLENKKSNTNSIWKVFNELTGGIHNNQTSKIHSLLVNDTIVTD